MYRTQAVFVAAAEAVRYGLPSAVPRRRQTLPLQARAAVSRQLRYGQVSPAVNPFLRKRSVLVAHYIRTFLPLFVHHSRSTDLDLDRFGIPLPNVLEMYYQ